MESVDVRKLLKKNAALGKKLRVANALLDLQKKACILLGQDFQCVNGDEME